MSNYINFSNWLQNRLNEDAPLPEVDPRVKAALDQKTAAAAQKNRLDISKIAKDPKAKLAAQQQLMANGGADVAANLFKNM
jgi:hypothetical protein